MNNYTLSSAIVTLIVKTHKRYVKVQMLVQDPTVSQRNGS